MAIRVQGPDGATVEFPDGTSPDVMQKAMQAHYGAPTQQQPRSVGQDLLRAGIMTGRAALHGVLSPVAALNDATLVPAINKVSELVGSNYREAPSGQQLDNLLNKTGLPNPQPENATERVVLGVDRGLGGLASGVGIGGLMRNAASPVAQGIGSALTSHLGT